MKNYDVYLAPWVKWLDERFLRGTVVINSQLLKSYLEQKYGRKEYSSYMRIGRQIKDFMNRYLPTRIELIKSISHKRDNENVQMPADSIGKLHELLVLRYDELKRKPMISKVLREISKTLGRCYQRELLPPHTLFVLKLYSSSCGQAAVQARPLTLSRRRP